MPIDHTLRQLLSAVPAARGASLRALAADTDESCDCGPTCDCSSCGCGC